ncbi:MAG: enoyl-CoA hydratase-related protein [Actinomycetota bacterium]|nr:enoyl-CoA hydratase-related protein [Actinomycetota bacterium]
MSTELTDDLRGLPERAYLKAFAEACRVVEEGLAGVREIDLAMSQGIGMAPGPFARADARGLDNVLSALEQAAQMWGESFSPPVILRRLVAQRRLGVVTGQGFYPYAQPEPGYEAARVKLDMRDDVAVLWLDNPPANVLSPEVVDELWSAWQEVESHRRVRAMVIASANPALFCAGADITRFGGIDERGARRIVDRMHELLRAWEHSGTMTIAAINGLAVGGGCELVMACDVRIATYSASFGQPEVKLGIMPGFGGSQRLPRLVGHAKALEMNATGESISAEEAYDVGLVNRVVEDHELFDSTLRWARKLGQQAPLALRELKLASYEGDLDRGIAAEKVGFATLVDSEDAQEGVAAFLEKRSPRFRGR